MGNGQMLETVFLCIHLLFLNDTLTVQNMKWFWGHGAYFFKKKKIGNDF